MIDYKGLIGYCNIDFFAVMFSGTDDDLPPSHRVPRAGGRVSGNGRPTNLPPSYPKMYDDVAADMEAQIHQIEKEAYISILRAFKAQADAITWVFNEYRSTLISLVGVSSWLGKMTSLFMYATCSGKRKSYN